MNEPGLTHISLSVDDIDAVLRTRRRVRRRSDRRLEHRRGRVHQGPRRPARRAPADGVPPPPRRASSRSCLRLRVAEGALEERRAGVEDRAQRLFHVVVVVGAELHGGRAVGSRGRRRDLRASRRTRRRPVRARAVERARARRRSGRPCAGTRAPARALAVAVRRRAGGVGSRRELRGVRLGRAFVVELPAAREHERRGVAVAEIALRARRVLVELDEPGLTLRRLEAKRHRRRRAAARARAQSRWYCDPLRSDHFGPEFMTGRSSPACARPLAPASLHGYRLPRSTVMCLTSC